MDVMEAIKERRSVRRFKGDPVKEEDLAQLLEAARWAPSWGNSQCWRFVIVKDPETREKLAQTCFVTRPDRPNRASEAIRTAPICLVACGELGRSGYKRTADGPRMPSTDKGDWYMFDLALAIQNLTLAAHSLGLATLHVGAFDSQKAGELVGVPEGVKVVEIMPLGYPDETPAAPLRKDLREWVYYDRYGKEKNEVNPRG